MDINEDKIFKHDIRILKKIPPQRKRYSLAEIFCDLLIFGGIIALGLSFFFI